MNRELENDFGNHHKQFYCSCDCSSEILRLNVWKWDGCYEMDVAIFSHYNQPQKLSLMERIRYCLRVLWYGKSYGDQMIFNENSIKKLKTFLNSIDV